MKVSVLNLKVVDWRIRGTDKPNTVSKAAQATEKDVFTLSEFFQQGFCSLFGNASSSVKWVESVVPQKVVLRIKTSLPIRGTCPVPVIQGTRCAGSFHSSCTTSCNSYNCHCCNNTRQEQLEKGSIYWAHTLRVQFITGRHSRRNRGDWSHCIYSKQNKRDEWPLQWMLFPNQMFY